MTLSTPRLASPFHATTQLNIVGLQICAQRRSGAPPGLPPQAALIDRRIFCGGKIVAEYWKRPGQGRYRIDWSDAGTFDLNAHTARVSVYSAQGASEVAIEEVLRGSVCSFVLLERRFEPLHASAVLLGGRCIAFAGASGSGKSSLAAYLSQQGATFFSDDVLPLKYTRTGVRAFPGFPQMRLTPASAHELRLGPPGFSSGKMTLPVRGSARGAKPIAAVYLLERRTGARGDLVIENLRAAQAFTALVSRTANLSQAAPWRMENQMRTLGWVAAHVPLRSLSYPSRYSAWPEMAELLLAR